MKFRLWWLALPLTACAGAPLAPTWHSSGGLDELRGDGALLLTNAGLSIATPGWTANANQRAATGCRQESAGPARLTAGTLREGDLVAGYRQTVRPAGDGWLYDLELTPTRATAVAAVLWRAILPLDAAAGGQWLLAGGDGLQRQGFPSARPETYVLANSATPRWIGWLGPRGGLKITPLAGFERVQLQDNRQWDSPQFEFQLYAAAGGRLDPARPLRLQWRLDPLSGASLAQEEQAMAATRVSFKQAAPLAIRGVQLSRPEVPRYARLELRLDLTATYDNPFDPAEINVQGEFRGPGGELLRVPGFLYQPCARQLVGGEQITPSGPPEWRLRFAPPTVGAWQYALTATDRSGTVSGPRGQFTCTASPAPGFVRISRDDPRYFAFDNGAPYFAIGANVCWPGSRGTFDYDDWFPAYARAGGNYARLWIGPFDAFTLERQAQEGREDSGLGRYDQRNAWRLDYVLELAEQQGLYLMFCAESFNALRSRPPYHTWQTYPYNAALGGPLAEPQQFFTDPAARRWFQNRLRYLVARYGYSPHVMSWEYWNEVDIIDRYVSAEVTAWHQEVSRYVRALDPWKHLQTTSYANSAADPAVDGLPEMDYTQTHNYGARDTAVTLTQWARRKRAFDKPHYVGEFGLDAGGAGADRDPGGDSLHDGLWATLAAGDAGVGMLWWWDSYIHPKNLYGEYAAIQRFVAGIDFGRAGLQPAGDLKLSWVTTPTEPTWSDLPLTGTSSSWEASPANQPRTLVVRPTGAVQGLTDLSAVQHGVRNHPALHNPVTFDIEFARAGRFEVVVRGVSGYGGAALEVKLNDAVVLAKEFADTNPAGKHETLTEYNGRYAVEVPAGRHKVTVENTGADWFFAEYLLPAYLAVAAPPLRAQGMQGPELAFCWVTHTLHTWSRIHEHGAPPAAAPTRLHWPLPPGRWRVETWDTRQGAVQASAELTAAHDGLLVDLPPLAADLALKAVRLP
ncbi:MAG: DUF5060 domain-containing protein [Fimbriimonadaceae bacterium]|nr:DUF5060 domain-containing protein [Fimbriimonadaceae bacterium]